MQININNDQLIDNKREIIMIAAMSENRVIGKDNAIPWSVKGNLAHFKKITMGWPCIMGRKTWESLPVKPLPGRLNIIISKTLTDETPDFFLRKEVNDKKEIKEDENPVIFSSITSAIDYCCNYKKMFICGGESIYRQAMPYANEIDLTIIPGQYEGDTYFPEIDENCWLIKNKEKYDMFSINIYKKIIKEKL